MEKAWSAKSGAPSILSIFSAFFFLSIKYTFDSEGGQKIKPELSVV